MYCSFPVDYTTFSLHDDYPTFLYTAQFIYIATSVAENQCSKFNILTMVHKLFFENSSSAAVNTLPNTIIYLKTVKYLNVRLRQIYQTNLELKIRVQKIEDRMLYYG